MKYVFEKVYISYLYALIHFSNAINLTNLIYQILQKRQSLIHPSIYLSNHLHSFSLCPSLSLLPPAHHTSPETE